MSIQTRREFLEIGAMALVGSGLVPGRWASAAAAVEVIEMRSDAAGARVWFDPIGLLVAPGTTVRWVARENVHTATAYHPRNDDHPLRIPAAARPWDSGYLVNPGDQFEVRLTVPGVYDYYCAPHEGAGMVGRIVVGRATGPGAEPFGYWKGRAGTDRWHQVPAAARAAFPGVARIMSDRRVHPASPRR